MVKFTHLLVMSVLIVWIAGAGCIGDDSSDVVVTQDVDEAGNAENSDTGLTPAEIQELDTDMAELESLLDNASPDEEIEIEIEQL